MADLAAMETQLQEALDEVEASFEPLRQERERLMAALAGLRGTRPRARASSGTRSTASAGGGAGAGGGDIRASIMQAVIDSPGQSATAYAESVGASAATVNNNIKALIEAGQVRREGERRATRYYPV